MDSSDNKTLNIHEKCEKAIKDAKYYLEEKKDFRKAIDILADFIVDEDKIEEYCLNPEVIQLLFQILLPPPADDEKLSEEEYNLREDRLKTYMEVINFIEEPSDLDEIYLNFKIVTNYIARCIYDALKKSSEKSLIFYPDISNEILCNTPQEINLGIQISPYLHRAIGPSKSTKHLYSDCLTQLIRMASIMFELNQCWRSLFGLPTIEHMSKSNRLSCVEDEDEWIIQKLKSCPFLIDSDLRQYLYHKSIYTFLPDLHSEDKPDVIITVSRNNALNDIVKKLTSNKIDASPYWNFEFTDEPGQGYGVTREFYSVVSRDLQNYDLHLFIGEEKQSSDGVKYVTSPCGLFPSPCLELDESSRNILITFGKIMAKVHIDVELLDIKFSRALYKYMIYGKNKAQCLNLNDIVDVMPCIAPFVNKLVSIMNEANKIKNETSLTPEKKSEETSKLTYDGSKLEDLYINFTIPGYPDMEMKEGGTDIFLKLDNVEEYLQLVVFWLLYKGPQEKLECLRYGYESYMSDNYDGLLIEDLDEILSGVSFKPWTLDELEENILLEDGLTTDSPIIKYLFDVLTSFEAEDQRNFLEFVTGAPNLDRYGLSDEKSKLTVKKCPTQNNNDFYLPMARTCIRTLEIPEYSSQDILSDKLLLAMREGRGTFQHH